MAVSYKKLWILLIERDMKKTDLRIRSGISTGALAKLGRNENVNTEVLAKICKALECKIEDIMEMIPEEEED
jgi:DNA-binding Xre family transcriptional regulator